MDGKGMDITKIEIKIEDSSDEQHRGYQVDYKEKQGLLSNFNLINQK